MNRKFVDVEEELHEAAVRSAGSSDFGDAVYRDGLRVLLRAFDTDVQLTHNGWRTGYALLLAILIGRLHAERGWAEHGEVLTVPIHRPLVITGLPRSGTTALHRLLSMDPQWQGLENWLTEAPMIRPPRHSWESIAVYRDCVARIEEFHQRVPNYRKAHDLAAEELAECGSLLSQNFVSTTLSVLQLPTYSSWLVSQSPTASYLRYANILRLIGAREPHRRWLLKNPCYLAEIETLMEVFPDACIVQTHRDPLKTIPSVCSLLHMSFEELTGPPARIGPRQCGYWHDALERTRAAAHRCPSRFFHVDHREFVSEPLRVVASIYDYFGMALSPAALDRMRAWVAASPTSRHGEHRYAIESWGITAPHLCEVFAEYREQHGF